MAKEFLKGKLENKILQQRIKMPRKRVQEIKA